MRKTTKAASLSILMFAMVGLIGFSAPMASAEGVGKGGYQLNLNGKDKGKGTTNCDNNGHAITVPLKGKFKILLSEGDFAVGDCNALDGSASFYLPDPTDLDGDGNTDPGLGCEGKKCTIGYHVYIRAHGGQGANFTVGPTCATGDPDGDGIDAEYCTTDDPITVSSPAGKGGGSKFTDVSKQMLTICVDEDGDSKCDFRIALFDDEFEDFLWNLENDGSRNTQLRFVIGTHTVG